MTNKFVKKYMRLAKAVADDQNPCLSRAIGAVIVNPEKNLVVSTGYNGPAAGVPHSDTFEFLSEYVYPQLSSKDKENICWTGVGAKFLLEKLYSFGHSCDVNQAREDFNRKINDNNYDCAGMFAKHFEGCKTCPRKLVGAISGERLGLCGCAHAEANAVNNAAKAGTSTFNCYMFCWCGIPCVDCTNSIINSGIRKVYCLNNRNIVTDMYNNDGNAWRMRKSGIEIVELDKEWILQD